MNGLTNKIKSDFKKGDAAEKLFQQLFPRKLTKASLYENKELHFDFKDDYGTTYDVKMHKGDLNYIEYQSENGFYGWIFGTADYIVFEIYSLFVGVDRQTLKFFCDQYYSEKVVFEKKLYATYRKKGRNDASVIVCNSDLIKLADFIIAKP